MSTPERDPRLDPKPGDVLRFGGYPYNRSYYEVLKRDPRMASTDVSYFHHDSGRERQKSISQWREWAAKAEVLQVVSASVGKKGAL